MSTSIDENLPNRPPPDGDEESATVEETGASRRLPPGPKPAPIFGWRSDVLRFYKNPIAYITALQETYGNIACLADVDHPPVFTRPNEEHPHVRTIFGFGREANREILSQPKIFQTARPRGPATAASQRLQDNILFLNGDKHKQIRRLINPTFSRRHLRSYHDDIVRYTDRMIQRWRPNEQIDLFVELHKLTRDIASRVLYGLEPTEDEDSLSHTIRRVIGAMFSPATMVPVDLPGTAFHRLRIDMEEVEKMLRSEIERKRAWAQGADDVLAMMIEAHDRGETDFSDSDLISNAFVLFFAGHDNAACALAWALFLLIQHPEIGEELFNELDRRLGGGPPSYDEIYDLEVLDNVIQESMRLLGPAVLFPRVAAQDTTLGDFDVPAGSEVVYSPYVTHLDPEVYEDPYRFIPGRWNDLRPPAYAYLPYGAGARRCIASSFAGMQLRTIIAILWQRCRLQMVEGAVIDIDVNVLISPKPGLPVVVKRQDRAFDRNTAPVGGVIRELVKFPQERGG